MMTTPYLVGSSKGAAAAGAAGAAVVGVAAADLGAMGDEALFARCKKCGLNARVWGRLFAAMLPEVLKRGLHRRKGFLSIHEFAAKLGGMSEYAVDKILEISRKIEDKPALNKLFISGTIGWSKIAKVAYVATKETDEKWAEKAERLSSRALEVYVQNYRRNSVPGNEGQAVFAPSQAPAIRFSCPVDEKVEFALRLVKQDLEKESKQSLSWNEAFSKMLDGGREFICKKCAKKIKNE